LYERNIIILQAAHNDIGAMARRQNGWKVGEKWAGKTLMIMSLSRKKAKATKKGQSH